MGCDIHLHTEVKVNGKWLHYGAPSIARWYSLFEKMAGVRGQQVNAIAAPKGLPDDISDLTALEFKRWEGDAHSMSWLSVEEIAQLEDWYKEATKDAKEYTYPEKQWGYLFSSSWGGLHKYKEAPDGVEDARFVFWFDN